MQVMRVLRRPLGVLYTKEMVLRILSDDVVLTCQVEAILMVLSPMAEQKSKPSRAPDVNIDE